MEGGGGLNIRNTYCSCSAAPDRIAHNDSAPQPRTDSRLVPRNTRNRGASNRDRIGIPATLASTSPLGL